MKQHFSLILAGIIGGLITLGGTQLLQKETAPITTPNYAKQINENLNVKASNAIAPFDFKEASALAMQSVVHIRAAESQNVANQRRQNDPFGGFFGNDMFNPYMQPRQGEGSGVIFSQDGYIVTNNHVVEFADEVEVTLFDNRSFNAKVIGTYPEADLAVLKIDATNLPVLENADSEAASVGEWVLAVGNPLELNSTVTAGIISAKGRNINIINQKGSIESFIQTDAAVNPGNSGGALVDAKGRLLGINTAIKTQTGMFAGYSFAIPVNLMQKIVNDIIKVGSYQRAYLGISIFELDSDYALEKGLGISQGVVIEALSNGGAAQYAGLLPGDVIVGVNNRKIRNAPDLQEIISQSKIGDIVNLKVNRKDKELEIPVHLK